MFQIYPRHCPSSVHNRKGLHPWWYPNMIPPGRIEEVSLLQPAEHPRNKWHYQGRPLQCG